MLMKVFANGNLCCVRFKGLAKPRANRIVRLLSAMEAAPELRESAYGWLSLTAETMKRSKATASRDFALARRIHGQFGLMFGRPFNTRQDRIKWSWDWSHYGFRTPESLRRVIFYPSGGRTAA